MKEDVPEDIKKNLTEYAKENGVDIKEVQKMFKEEYNSDYMNGYTHDEKCKQAAFVVRAELASSFGGNVVYDGVVFQTTPPQEKPTKDDPSKTYKFSDIYGMFKSSEKKKGKCEPIKIRCFGDTAGLTSDLPLNTMLKINVSESEYQGNLNLSIGGDSIGYTEPEGVKDGFNLRDFIQEQLGEPIRIEEVPYKRSKDDDEKKIVKGRVKSRRIGVSKKGNLLAKYTIYDDERGVDDVMYISTMLTDQLWDKGALVWAIGTNSEPDKEYKNESMFCDFVVGLLPKKVGDKEFDAMVRNALEEEKKTIGSSSVPSEVPEEPDTSGLQEVMNGNVEPDVDLKGWGN